MLALSLGMKTTDLTDENSDHANSDAPYYETRNKYKKLIQSTMNIHTSEF